MYEQKILIDCDELLSDARVCTSQPTLEARTRVGGSRRVIQNEKSSLSWMALSVYVYLYMQLAGEQKAINIASCALIRRMGGHVGVDSRTWIYSLYPDYISIR